MRNPYRLSRLGRLVLIVGMIGASVSVALAQPPLITEFPIPTPGSGPLGITASADGNLWFTERNGNQIGRITPSGFISEFPIPTASSDPVDITPGPDGNLWFTEFNANQIGRITPSGVITEFPVPTASSGPDGITAGPDGNLWFTEYSGNQIGRITPAGVVTEFLIPTAGSGPVDITPGPDGNLWFTEFLKDQIGRITPAGVITEFPVPTIGPRGITLGPDGNLWFVGFYAVGQITPAGVPTQFPIPTASSTPVVITAGSDGNLWFTESGAHQIARITPDGDITEFPVPTADSGPLVITASPDGNLWFTETIGRIGRVLLNSPTPPVGTLTVTRAGPGSGTVTGPDIQCGTQCSTAFSPGLVLTATAGPGSSFAGWSGACGGTGLCIVGASTDATVTATFARAPFQGRLETSGANNESRNPAVSGDGQVVAFQSTATNLAAPCTTGVSQIFVRDRATGVTTCVSVAGDGAPGNLPSVQPAISDDGRFVAFASTAINLAGPCTTGQSQIFVFDRLTGATACESVVGSTPGDGASESASLSGDGQFVAFASAATNLASPCAGPDAQVFVRDRQGGVTTCVSVAAGVAGNGPSGHPVLSGDSQFLAFHSSSTNLASPCTGGVQQIFVYDRIGTTLGCESVDASGVEGNAASAAPDLDDAGNVLAFESLATNLAAPCTTGSAQIFLRNRRSGIVVCASLAPNGSPGNGASTAATLSGNGGRLAYVSGATNLMTPRAGGPGARRITGQPVSAPDQILGADIGPAGDSLSLTAAEVLSESSGGELGGASSGSPALNADGSVAAFQSGAQNLAEGSTASQNVLTVEPGRVRFTAPVQGIQLSLDIPTSLTISWTALPGAAQYGVEFTGTNRQFANPNGATIDPVNGYGGAGGAFPITGTSLSGSLGAGIVPGTYQIRILGLAPGLVPIGTFSDALNIVLGFSNRPAFIAPAPLTTFPPGSILTLAWTPVPGALQYGIEFTGANRVFSNPNGVGPDPVNGYGGAGGGLLVQGTGLTAVIPPGLPPGSYQLRIIGLSATSAVGVFSDAVTVVFP